MTEREKLLREAIKTIIKDRQDQYGRPENNFAKIVDLWNAYLHNYSGASEEINLTSEDVAIMMELMKIARISTGHRAKSTIMLICVGTVLWLTKWQQKPV